jgi:abnormal spindle-like microcephaly-associated protein
LVRDELILSHFAATEIQRVWRGFTQFCDYFVHLEAIVKIQAFVRKIRCAVLLAKLRKASQVEKRFYNVKARTIQRAVRLHLHRLHIGRASVVIQRLARSFIRQRRYTKVDRGVKKLQAIVRAAKVRRLRSKKVAAVVTRLDVANRKARRDPKLQIGYKTRHALNILQTSRSLAEIMDAVKSLETSTRLSSLCCILFTEANAANILLDLIRSCNRSVPHVELVQCILLTLDNIAQYRSLVPSFADCNAAEIFLDKMQMFRDKDGIFCLSTSLLDCISKCNPIVEDFCAMHEHLKRLKALHALSLRRSKSSTSATRQDLGTKLNRMRRREHFDRNLAIKSLGSMVAKLESRVLVTAANENGTPQHFTF